MRVNAGVGSPAFRRCRVTALGGHCGLCMSQLDAKESDDWAVIYWLLGCALHSMAGDLVRGRRRRVSRFVTRADRGVDCILLSGADVLCTAAV